MIDLELVRQKVAGALPRRVRWIMQGSHFDTGFDRARHPLRPIADDDVNAFEIPNEWLAYYLFGDQDVDEGGGAYLLLCVHGETGEVFELDVESSECLRLLNTDIDRFIATFDVFDRALRLGSVPVDQLARLAAEIDPAASANGGQWPLIAEYAAPDDDAE